MNPVDRLTQAKPTAGEARRAKELNRAIDRLPNDGAVMVVGAYAVAPIVRRIIHDRRGADVAAATRVIVAPTERDEAVATRHLAVPIHRDPFLKDQREHAAALAHAWRF